MIEVVAAADPVEGSKQDDGEDLLPQLQDQPEENKSMLVDSLEPEMVFDEREELEKIRAERAKGKAELVGCIFLNKPSRIIGSCQDQFEELLYLVAYESTGEEVYTPTWCQSWLVIQVDAYLIDDYIRRIMVPYPHSIVSQ